MCVGCIVYLCVYVYIRKEDSVLEGTYAFERVTMEQQQHSGISFDGLRYG